MHAMLPGMQAPEQLLEEWITEMTACGREPATIKTYASSVRTFLRWAREQDRTGLAEQDVYVFIGGIAGAANTRKTKAMALKAFFAWLARRNVTDGNLLAGYKPARPDEVLVDGLSEEEVSALAAACGNGTFCGLRDKALFLMGISAGARIGELLRLDFRDLNMGLRQIRLRHTKGDRERIAPYDGRAADALAAYLAVRGEHEPGSPLWTGYRTGKRICYSTVQTSLGRRAAAAGIAGFRPHRMRNTAGINFLKAKGSPQHLQVLGGWASAGQLAHYVRTAANDLALQHAREVFAGREQASC